MTTARVRLDIIGLGVEQPPRLSTAAQQALTAADAVFGSVRQLQSLEDCAGTADCIELPPLRELKAALQAYAAAGNSRLVLLASGDPLFYGIGRWCQRQLGNTEIVFHPGISSIQAACHRTGFSLQDLQHISLHGRPLSSLRRWLQPGQKLIMLTDRHSQPLELARECIRAGLEQSRLTVCEALGYPQEQVRHFAVTELLQQEPAFDPLNVCILECAGGGGVQPVFPGIADEDFETGSEPGQGLLSKREVRLMILSLLQPGPGQVIWDIGAGCGGVAVELARWQPAAQIYALEKHPQRFSCLEQNCQRFGTEDNLHCIAGRAPEALQALPAPDSVFIGGSGGELEQLLAQVWQQLPLNGRLVLSAVTETSRHIAAQFDSLRQHDATGFSTQLAVSRRQYLAGQPLYRPQLPVTLFQWIRTSGASE